MIVKTTNRHGLIALLASTLFFSALAPTFAYEAPEDRTNSNTTANAYGTRLDNSALPELSGLTVAPHSPSPQSNGTGGNTPLTKLKNSIGLGGNQIKGGESAVTKDVDWVSLIITKYNEGGTEKFNSCTGSLIGPGHVLTAAHCIRPGFMQSQLYFKNQSRSPVVASKSVVHPSVDLAILYLDKPITDITPVAIASREPVYSQLLNYYGWGGEATSIQHGIYEHVSYCSFAGGFYGEELKVECGEPRGPNPALDMSSFFGSMEPGDSGGPLVGGNQLYGVASGAGSEYDTFASVATAGTWINQNTGVYPGQQVLSGTGNAEVGRIGGVNRVDTALQVFKSGSFAGEAVVIASGRQAPDALTATALASAAKGPVLLTMGGPVESNVIDAVLTAGKKRVFIVGGMISLSQSDQARLKDAGVEIEYLAGKDRYETAQKVAQRAVQYPSTSPIMPVFMVDGASFADALSVGAAAGNAGGVILLTGPTKAHTQESFQMGMSLRKAAMAKGKVSRLVAAGGQSCGALNDFASNNELSSDQYSCLVGSDRYQTAQLVNEAFFTPRHPYFVVSGENFPDGLAAGALAATQAGAVMLTPSAGVPAPLASTIRADRLSPVTIVGGPGAVSVAVDSGIRANRVS